MHERGALVTHCSIPVLETVLFELGLNRILPKTSICETSSGTVTNYKKNFKNISKNLAKNDKNVPRKQNWQQELLVSQDSSRRQNSCLSA